MDIHYLPKDYIGYVSWESFLAKAFELIVFLWLSATVFPWLMTTLFNDGAIIWGIVATGFECYCAVHTVIAFLDIVKGCKINRNYRIEQGKLIAKLNNDLKAYTEKELIELSKKDAFESECE